MANANTMTKISTVTVGNGGQAAIEFTSIPATYTDLRIVISADSTHASTSDEMYLKLNGSTASIYSWKMLYGTGTATASASDSAENYGIAGVQIDGSTATASVFSNGEIYISNYASADYKSILMEHYPETNAVAITMKMTAGLWSSTAAITSLSLSGGNGDFVQYSTATLYGIKATTATTALATGGTITYNGGYVYHTFLSSGTFTPSQSLVADCLVIAGGGAGGGDRGGGGGAGGLLYFASNSLTATGYAVTVGDGGTGTTGAASATQDGGVSSFGSLTAATGGGAGNHINTSGRNGGSGGGGSISGTGGVATSDQGNSGGNGATSAGGGGGGYAAVGANAASSTGGAGGAGTNAYSTYASATSTGVSGYYAGGGGGGANTTAGTGGAGGGGAGNIGTPNVQLAGTAGTANTGGGGGGSSNWGASQVTSAAGGSGIVIVRYQVQ